MPEGVRNSSGFNTIKYKFWVNLYLISSISRESIFLCKMSHLLIRGVCNFRSSVAKIRSLNITASFVLGFHLTEVDLRRD